MIKIPIITQNFSSPDVFSDTPLMLLPQALSPLPDKDQEGFSQLLLHDLYRHRQSYVRSYTAFETLKKRQDFVLRQENLRSLQSFEQRITTKQDQVIDQSIHSYEQCFVKVINGNSTTNGNIHNQQRRIKMGSPSFDKFHMHQLSHIPATPLEPPPMIPFHRYQKSHRPPLLPKYRSCTNLYRSSQSFHDAFQSSTFSHRSQPFISFTESYLQKYADRSSKKFHYIINDDEIEEKQEEDEEQQNQFISIDSNLTINKNKKQDQKSKTSDLQHIRPTASSRNTNTPSSTPRLGYNDALRDGLTVIKDNEDHSNRISAVNDKRLSSKQSTSQISNNNNSKTNTKRSKREKNKQQLVVNLTSDKKSESLTPKTPDSDLLETAITVQNYDNNPPNQSLSSKIERLQLPTNITKKLPSVVRRSSIKSNDINTGVKQILDNIDTQMTTTTTTTTKTTTTTAKPTTTVEKPITDNNQEQFLLPITNNLTENNENINDQLIQQELRVELAENRKRIKKGAFDSGESMNDLIAFELGMMGNKRAAMRKTRFRLGKENNQNGNEIELTPENQATLELIEKFRENSSGLSIGQPSLSQKSCRFELPFDLKLLENLTPLEYLSKYCRLSSRRNYQFKRLFDKYRNNHYRLESSNLYQSITDIHTETFTPSQYDDLCQLIDLGNEQHQFTFDTFAGILALCERILFGSSQFRSGLDEHDLAKDTLEQCDFDGLDRKFDGLDISDTMKRLLKTL